MKLAVTRLRAGLELGRGAVLVVVGLRTIAAAAQLLRGRPVDDGEPAPAPVVDDQAPVVVDEAPPAG